MSGSSGGTPLGSDEYSSNGSEARQRLGSASGGGSSGEQTSPHFRGFSFKNLGMLAEQNLEALRVEEYEDEFSEFDRAPDPNFLRSLTPSPERLPPGLPPAAPQ